MEKQNLFRIALVLRDSSNTTRDKKLFDIVSLVLAETHEPKLSSVALSEAIERDYSLTFDALEIEAAIKRKGESGKTINGNRNGYWLPESEKSKIREKESIQRQLGLFVQSYFNEYPDRRQADNNLSELVYRYIYHCFTKSTNNLLFLLQGKVAGDISSFEAADIEVSLLDDFITWDNPEKNKLLYSIISCCYEYCMLSVKRHSLSASNLFSGKKFYLDANIIFRLAGFNNDERQYVTRMFVKKCHEANVELIITDETYTEINRVIDAQVQWIRNFTKGQPPINPEALRKFDFSYKTNDFYSLFYSWTRTKGNSYRDYSAFRTYLYDQVRVVLHSISYETINSPHEKETEDFKVLAKSLEEYKFNHGGSPSKSSIDADIINLQYVQSRRKASSMRTIWGTNEFFVTADQQLTNWAQDKYSGVPLVVIPSVWLSILLKLTGRADDDYSAFCSFLRLPAQNNQPDIIDVELFTDILSTKTSNADLKERIIDSVSRNSSSYTFDTREDYERAIEGAFDIIRSEDNERSIQTANEEKRTLEDKLTSLQTQLEESQNQSIQNEQAIRQDEKRKVKKEMLDAKVLEYMTKYKRCVDHWAVVGIICVCILGVGCLVLFYLCFTGTNIGNRIIGFLPQNITDVGAQIAFIEFSYVVVTALISLIGSKVFKLLKSPEHMDSVRDRYEKKIEKEYI